MRLCQVTSKILGNFIMNESIVYENYFSLKFFQLKICKFAQFIIYLFFSLFFIKKN